MQVESPGPSVFDEQSRASDELADALANGPFHRALQLAIANSGLALSRLEYRLEQRGFHVGRSTLSYWQQGRRRPERPDSLEALRVLEEVLGIPTNALTSLLGPRKPRGRWIAHQNGSVGWADMWGDSEEIKRLILSDSRRNADRLRDISITERIELGADRRMRTLAIQTVTRAAENGADRSLLVLNADADLDVARLKVVDLENARIGRTRVVPQGNFVAYELLFDHSLVEKETYLYSYGVDFASARLSDGALAERGIGKAVATDGLRRFRRPVLSYVMEVRFDPRMLPVRCYHVTAARVGDQQHQVAELILNSHQAAHVAMQNVTPGVHGIHWEWE